MKKKYTLEELKALARESGIVGAGGAGFPMYAKLDGRADAYILNCAECEPVLKLHRQLLEAHTRQILTAMQAVVRALNAKCGYVAVKEHYTETVDAVKAEISDFPELELKLLPAVYPSGDELLLIREVTGRTVAPGALPISEGVIVNNVETVYNLYRAMRGFPVTHKYVTVAGAVAEPKTVMAPIGTTVGELVALAGGATVKNPAYLIGGPMMGVVGSARDTVAKTTNAVIVLPKNHTAVMNRSLNAGTMLRRAMSVCCQCRSCTELCSRHSAGYPIEPHAIMRVLSNGGKGDKSCIPGIFYCSGCGLCEAYSCPQGLSPRLLIAELKKQARQNGITAPKGVELNSPPSDEKLRRVSSDRLSARLGLTEYDVEAAFIEKEQRIERVRVPLGRYIGAPSAVAVKEGDTVVVGDVIGVARENALSVNVHAPINGKITEITEVFVEITAC